ncbi:lipopolysaccharide biosynthesis protein, partial [Bacteroides thetaiotaomicron]|nr:lipopolysaccharide biosynthesis protein [Bacteroides thetaiotaomicron]
MEENQSAKNIRIAKNTFFLYLRMFLMMVISLYTSRIVLSTLGEVDYGLYNVVGGIVTMFTF